MKALPCETPHCGIALLQDGKPYIMGGPPADIHRGRYRYKCSRCKRTSSISAEQFRLLAELSLSDLRAIGMEHLVTKDLLGAGVTEEQIAQLEQVQVEWASLNRTIEVTT